MSQNTFDVNRRKFLALSGGAAAVAGASLGACAVAASMATTENSSATQNAIEPFWGRHQGGILTPAQGHTYFAVLDFTTDKREDVIELLQKWTVASARMAKGQSVEPVNLDGVDEDVPDTGDALGLSPARLTITFGFGVSLFTKDGKDRYGISAKRPEALVDLPAFSGDQLDKTRTGGDLSMQACADDPQVAFHAVRQLLRMADGIVDIRWVQTGFIANPPGGGTARNLMGFKDGTGNPPADDLAAMNQFIWVGKEGPDWMRDGSYLVARRTRIALEHWDKMKVAFQEQTFGREKISGAPIGMKNEKDAINLDAIDKDGNPLMPENSHVRLATAASNEGAKILRRSYSYNDGVNFTAERWPPWRQGMEYDAGLLFVCYQRDPRTGFIKIFDKMSKFDMMNQFVTHVGSGLFACPPGAKEGEFIGQQLFQSTEYH
jgi:deferrochelatase/peroxidase EfeB